MRNTVVVLNSPSAKPQEIEFAPSASLTSVSSHRPSLKLASYRFLFHRRGGGLSRTLFNDEALKVVAFGFSAGQELSTHTAPMAAVLHFLKGEAELTLGNEKRNVRAGAVVHMAPGLTHGIIAKTPLVMLLLMLKQVKA